jgi:hypothetical protein
MDVLPTASKKPPSICGKSRRYVGRSASRGAARGVLVTLHLDMLWKSCLQLHNLVNNVRQGSNGALIDADPLPESGAVMHTTCAVVGTQEKKVQCGGATVKDEASAVR